MSDFTKERSHNADQLWEAGALNPIMFAPAPQGCSASLQELHCTIQIAVSCLLYIVPDLLNRRYFQFAWDMMELGNRRLRLAATLFQRREAEFRSPFSDEGYEFTSAHRAAVEICASAAHYLKPEPGTQLPAWADAYKAAHSKVFRDLSSGELYRRVHRLLSTCRREILEIVARQAGGSSALEIMPGGIKYGAATVELGGKPLACIRELFNALQQRLDWETLRNRVWGQDAYTEKGTIKNAVKDARDALRKLARKSGVPVDETYDPLPCVDHGKDLAWKLSFPE